MTAQKTSKERDLVPYVHEDEQSQQPQRRQQGDRSHHEQIHKTERRLVLTFRSSLVKFQPQSLILFDHLSAFDLDGISTADASCPTDCGVESA